MASVAFVNDVADLTSLACVSAAGLGDKEKARRQPTAPHPQLQLQLQYYVTVILRVVGGLAESAETAKLGLGHCHGHGWLTGSLHPRTLTKAV